MDHLNYNGKLYQSSSAVLPAGNRGLKFGDGLFETMKCINGNVEDLDEHFARLWKGLNTLQFNLSGLFTPDRLEEEILALLKKNAHQQAGRIRLTVFKGEGGLYDTVNHAPNYIIQTWPLPAGTGDWNSNGLVVGIYQDVKKNCDILSNIKHNNFLPYALAAMYAKKQQWNDALLLNTEGGICDTTIANIFLIKDAVIYTPDLQQGCIAGVMRKNILSKLTALNYTCVESKLNVTDLQAADEVFLTNSIYNMRWIQRFEERKYSCIMAQKIYAAIFSTNA